MMTPTLPPIAALAAAAMATAAQAPPDPTTIADVLARASAYVVGYEQAFSLLVAEERYAQEVRRSNSGLGGGGNLSQSNPGGGFSTDGGGVRARVVLRSDYLLVQLGPASGWMPFRDVFEVNGRPVADRDDRLANLFLTPGPNSFERASRIMADSTRHNLGSVTRTVNIPILALMFLHPEVRGRFDFERKDVGSAAGRDAWEVGFHERERPTLVRGLRGRDLPVSGAIWIEPSSGMVVKTTMTAADQAVRAVVTTTYREDAALQLWVPERMEDRYRTTGARDEITGVATYSNFRRFSVNTDEVLRRPPPE